MVFGYQQGGSFSQHKQALGFDAAASEQMRLKQITEQRKREQQMRAKQDVQSKEVKLRIVKDEISRRSMDLKRVEASVAKLSAPSHSHTENFDLKIRELKNKIKDIEKEIEKEQSLKAYAEKTGANQARELSVVSGRKKLEEGEISRLKIEEHHLETEIAQLKRLAM
jgi:hypothetical protein